MFNAKAIVGNIQSSQCVYDNSNGITCPAEVLQLSVTPENNRIRLLCGTITAEAEENPLFKRTFVLFKTTYHDKWVELDTATGDVTFHNLDPDFMSTQQYDKVSIHHALSFIMETAQRSNLFVYALFTEENSTIQSRYWDLNTIVPNLMRHIQDLSVFEKVVKVSGEKFLFSNLGKKDFQLSNGKKLRRVMGIPDEVRAYIKTAKLEDLFPKFQKLSENPNDIKDFCEYLKAAKKICKYDRYSLDRFITAVTELFEVSDLSLRQILSHLIRENFFFGRLYLPTNEAAEWKDCLTMAAASNIAIDKCPQNITKYHLILAKNVDILAKPRTEEFEKAVSLYSRLEKEMEDEGYIIRPPKSEYELVEEGNVLHHCVASYRDKIIDEHAVVLFCRKADDPSTPLYTIELDYTPGDTSFSVVQFKKLYDADVTDPDLLKMLNKYLQNRRYLIEGGKNLFRLEKKRKPKKDEDETKEGED